jgi:hypothetical protein
MRKLPERNYTRTNPTTRLYTRTTPPERLFTRQTPPPTPPRRDYRESYIYSVNTEEPTTLIGDHSCRVYAKIPEHSAIRADSHIRGVPGQVTYQETRSTQTTDPWLSSFQRSFANMKL